MLSDKQAVFFDAGFTLLEPTRTVADVYFAAIDSLGVSVPEDQFRGRLAEAWPKVTREYRSAHPDFESSEELERDAWRRFTRLVAEPFPQLLDRHEVWLQLLFDHFDASPAWRPNPGAVDVLTRLRAKGIVVGVVSNWHTSLHQILEGLEMKGLCDFVLTSAEAGRKKPHRRIFEQALGLSGVDRRHTVHIGDSWDDDIQGARAAGLQAIYFCRSEPPTDADSAVPTVRCLTQLLS